VDFQADFNGSWVPKIGAEDLYNGTEISILDPSSYLQETPKNFELLFAALAGFASAFSR
jgi:hypothetical protein